jgi:hypothetical protein
MGEEMIFRGYHRRGTIWKKEGDQWEGRGSKRG